MTTILFRVIQFSARIKNEVALSRIKAFLKSVNSNNKFNNLPLYQHLGELVKGGTALNFECLEFHHTKEKSWLDSEKALLIR